MAGYASPGRSSLLQVGDGGDDHGGFRVYADPAGHPFCLCWGPPPLGEVAASHLGHPSPQRAPVAGGAVSFQVVDPGEDRAQAVMRGAAPAT